MNYRPGGERPTKQSERRQHFSDPGSFHLPVVTCGLSLWTGTFGGSIESCLVFRNHKDFKSQQRAPMKRNAFTLIELVVVIIIVAILTAVAVPKFYDRADDAREAATLQSLSTLRGATELFRADTGSYPTVANLATDLAGYIKGPFPETKVGGVESAAIKSSTSNPIPSSETDDAGGWIYNASTGEIKINMASHFAF